jgi:hypothetical protein
MEDQCKEMRLKFLEEIEDLLSSKIAQEILVIREIDQLRQLIIL